MSLLYLSAIPLEPEAETGQRGCADAGERVGELGELVRLAKVGVRHVLGLQNVLRDRRERQVDRTKVQRALLRRREADGYVF